MKIRSSFQAYVLVWTPPPSAFQRAALSQRDIPISCYGFMKQTKS